MSIGAKENEESGKYVPKTNKSKYARRSYGVTHSLTYAVARISTEKTKVNTSQELRRNTLLVYAVTTSSLEESSVMKTTP